MAEAKKTASKDKAATSKKAPAAKTTKKATKPVTTKEEVVTDGIIEESVAAPVEANTEDAEEVTEQGETLGVKGEEKPVAKAGKRSEKSIKEAEEKVAKEERKAAKEVPTAEAAKPKIQHKPARPIIERRSKGFRKVAELIEEGKNYSLKDALVLATKTSPVKFDATVELHARLGVDPRQADQNLRDTVVLPAGTGKTVRIAVFADADGVAAAKKAGADIVAADEFLQQLEKGTIDFDVLISTPANMAKLGKYARLLGPKGLMPNPKSGTVTNDVAKAVTEAKAGRVEYRIDSTGIIHVGVGKVSFGPEKLLQNTQAIVNSIQANKPSSLKSAYVKSLFVTTSMGPSIPVDISEI